MKKYSLPVQLFKILVSLILSISIIYIVGDSILVDMNETPKWFEFIETVIAIIFALLVVIIYDYNEICRAKSTMQKAKQDVKSALDVRKQLIGKAEKVVDKYVDKETELYTKFAEARKDGLSAVTSLKAISETYPDLKSNAGVQKLLSQLEDVERLILQAKNQCTYFIAEYNTIIHTFPVVLIKPVFKWKDEETNIIFEEELVTDEELGI